MQFGWFTPPLGIRETGGVPLAIYQQEEILPVVTRYFDSLWVPDHLYAFGDRTQPFLECMTTLTWLAARFPNVKVGPIVLAVGFRHPALLAKMAATLQALSGGRFVMGIGGGWRREEYGAYGYPFPSARERIEQLDEGVQIMRLMWSNAAPTFEGRYFRIENAYCEPRPDPPPPVMIGGTGEQFLLPLAARMADIWDLYHDYQFDNVDLDNYRLKRDALHRHAEALARDPAEIGHSLTIGQARLPNNAEETRRWLDQVRIFAGLGITQLILDCGHVTSPEPVLRFGEEVMSAFSRI